jgi:hypothetical protein
MWLPQGEKAPTRARSIISTPSVMIIIFWLRLGLPVIDTLPAGEKFTARYFSDNIVPQIAEQRPSDARQNRGRKFVVHMDNATPHRAKLTKPGFKTQRRCEADHPPYSPDFAPSDFYLFGRLKGKWQEANSSLQRIFWRGSRLTNAISREELESSFQEWERRLGKCIRIDGEDVREKNLVN